MFVTKYFKHIFMYIIFAFCESDVITLCYEYTSRVFKLEQVFYGK